MRPLVWVPQHIGDATAYRRYQDYRRANKGSSRYGKEAGTSLYNKLHMLMMAKPET